MRKFKDGGGRAFVVALAETDNASGGESPTKERKIPWAQAHEVS
ncbi:MAG TPA: hypothetical protein VMW10_08455 [Alphaproteobacteria bacterium]|nr:hypothetical protein [Alphaproteobacteria bacterium]